MKKLIFIYAIAVISLAFAIHQSIGFYEMTSVRFEKSKPIMEPWKWYRKVNGEIREAFEIPLSVPQQEIPLSNGAKYKYRPEWPWCLNNMMACGYIEFSGGSGLIMCPPESNWVGCYVVGDKMKFVDENFKIVKELDLASL